jgi:hypothetical protein
VEPIPNFAELIQQHLRRTDWGNFPDVVIHAEEALVKKHPRYAVAKAGDVYAAKDLVLQTLANEALDRIRAIIGGGQPHLLAIHALETDGANAIPGALSQVLSKLLRLPLANGIIQINRVSHTGASGYYRLAFPALFDGPVNEPEYFLVDDFIGQGGTLANLKGFVESRGASVVGATVLTGKGYSAKLRLTEETLRELRRKHRDELEQWWIAAFGYGFEKLTESKARYLLRGDNAHAISARIVASV